MPGSHAMEVPAAPKGAGLVSVDGRTYPLESARVEAEATGGIARSTVVQTYRNPYAEPLEVIYTLPLPADGAVVGYTMRLGDRVVQGEVRPRAQARKDYEKAIFEGRSAALLEQQRDDTFSQRLGSLPGGQAAEITIEVLHPLAFLAGAGDAGARWEYRFPTVASVRYEGAPGRVPDADALDVDRGGTGEIPTRIELKLTVVDDAGARVLAIESMPLDRDLVMRWPAGRTEVGVQLAEGPGLSGDDGRYALVTITPPAAPAVAFARDLTILIDASGSMHGLPIEWAKRVAIGLLSGLAPSDRFEVIAFANKPQPLTRGLVSASEGAVRDALREIRKLAAGGGTEMVDAMVEALHPLRRESQRQVVLISDGQIGFEDEVVRRVRDGLPEGARLHTVGVGAAPNRTLTARAARVGRGVETFVCGEAEVEGAISRLVAATARPVLTDLRFESAAVKGAVPARPRDVFAGQPLTMALELAEEGGAIEISGRLAGSSERWRWRVDVPPIAMRVGVPTPVPLGALYGRELIADLDASGPFANDRVEQVAMRHRIASRMTSLVAIADEPAIDPRKPRRRVVLPVEVPAYQSAEALGLHGAARLHGMHFALADFDGTELGSRERMAYRDARLSAPAAPATPTIGFFRRLVSRQERGVLRGRVLRIDGDLIVIEYETPSGSFAAPSADVSVTRDGVVIAEATVDESLSSQPGPHGKGLLLRMALRRSGGWTEGEELTLTWGCDFEMAITVEAPE